MLSRSVSNIICSVIFGRRFDYDDEYLLSIIRLTDDNLTILNSRWGEVRRPSYLGDRGGDEGVHTHSNKNSGRGLDCNWPTWSRPFSSDPAPELQSPA